MKTPTIRANKRQQVTIKEVAERAGVSLMTVSRVLNNKHLVREATRKKVEDAIRELDYRPNSLARSLAGGRSLMIGLLHENPSHSYLSKLFIGALNACRSGGHHLVLERLPESENGLSEEMVRDALGSACLDGIILPSPICTDQTLLSVLDDMNMPYVRIGPHDADPRGLKVTVDDFEAARMMTNYLLDQGHTRIGFVTGAYDQDASTERLRGYRHALQERGITPDPALVAGGAFTYRSGMEAAERLLSLDDRPSVIFASNDDMAAGVVMVALRMGLKIPGDLSVTGFDDTAIASTIWPPLTTFHSPITEMASTAVEVLACGIQGDLDDYDPVTGKVLSGEIVIRESVAGR